MADPASTPATPTPLAPTPLALGPLPGPHALTVHLSAEAYDWLQRQFGGENLCPDAVAHTWYGSHLLDICLKQDRAEKT